VTPGAGRRFKVHENLTKPNIPEVSPRTENGDDQGKAHEGLINVNI